MKSRISTCVGRRIVVLVAIFVFNGAVVGLATAAETSAPKPKVSRKAPAAAEPAHDRVAAKQAYEEALRAFNLGHWEDAVAGFERSYTLSGDPALLFNVAQAQRQGGNVKQAIIAYKAFLREKPDTPHREMIEAKLKELESGNTTNTASAKPGDSKPQPDRLAGVWEDPFERSKEMPAETPALTPAVATPAPTETVSPSPPESTAMETAPHVTPAFPVPPLPNQAQPPASALDLRQQPATQDTSVRTGNRWWLWTGVGAIVAAGVATAIILSTRGTERDTSCPAGVNGCLPVGK